MLRENRSPGLISVTDLAIFTWGKKIYIYVFFLLLFFCVYIDVVVIVVYWKKKKKNHKSRDF